MGIVWIGIKEIINKERGDERAEIDWERKERGPGE